MSRMGTWFKHRYDTLVDVAFWSFLLQSIIPMMRTFGLTDFRTEGIWDTISFITFYGTWFLLAFLVLRRSVRDEYAQEIWTKAAASMTKLMVFVPIPLSFLLLVVVLELGPGMASITTAQIPLGEAAEARFPPVAQQLLGLTKLIFKFGIYFPFLFVSLYKWQCWRDR